MTGNSFTIAYDPDFAPVSRRDARGQPEGIAIDVLTRALHAAGIGHAFQPVEMARQEDELALGRVAAIAALGVTAQRRAIFDFSPVILHSGAAFFAPPGFDPLLPGARIATPVAGPLAGWLACRFPAARIRQAADYAEALREVQEARADAAALNWHVGRELCANAGFSRIKLPPTCFLAIDLALAVRRNTFSDQLAALAANWPRLALDSAAPIDD